MEIPYRFCEGDVRSASVGPTGLVTKVPGHPGGQRNNPNNGGMA